MTIRFRNQRHILRLGGCHRRVPFRNSKIAGYHIGKKSYWVRNHQSSLEDFLGSELLRDRKNYTRRFRYLQYCYLH